MADDSEYSAFPSEDEDPTKMLAGVLSPASAQSLVPSPPDLAPRTGAAVTTPQTGSLATAPQQATPKNLDTAAGRQSYNIQPAQPVQSPTGAVQPAQSAQPVQQASAVQPLRPAGVQPAVSRPLQPASMNPDPMASLRPGGSNPAMPALPGVQPAQVNAPSQMDIDQTRRNAIINSRPGWQNIKNPVGKVAAGVGNAALSFFLPTVAPFVPGTTANYQQRLGVANQNLQADTAQADTASQAAQRSAEAAKNTAMAQSDAPMTPSAEQAAAVGHPELAGLPIPPRTYSAMLTAKQRADSAEQVGAGHDDVRALAQGMKATTGPDGKTTYVPDPDSPVTQAKQAQTQLAQAKAELARAGNDPRSPAYQLAFKKAQTAQQNANAATTRATAYMGQYMQRAYNKGLGGDTLPGAPIIGNDEGTQTVVGTGNANTAIKGQANVAQFNDVFGALGSLENSAKALVQSGGKLNSPRVAAMLAQPPGTLGKWLQGEGAKSGATPQERDYAIANAAAHENVQAMRKAAGGTATDSSVKKLDDLIPGASTPDLDYFLRQTGQIRSTAQRLGTGVTTAAGGSHLRPGGSAPPAGGQPPQSVVDGMKEGQYVHGPGGSFQKKGGKLVPAGNQ